MIIKSSKALCEDYLAISKLAHETGEPIYITYEGEGDLVLMSIDAHESIGNPVRKIKPNPENKTISIDERSGGMSELELANILKEMYDNAPKGDQVAHIHLFSIKYANELEHRRIDKKEILKYADLPVSYQTEISKGIKLAQYVDIKPQYS